MTARKLARRADNFVLKADPNSPASKSQRYLVQRLSRTRTHDLAAEIGEFCWNAAYTAGEADRDIKLLTHCPVVRTQTRKEVITAAEEVLTDWEALAKNGSLGKVAQKKALALV